MGKKQQSMKKLFLIMEDPVSIGGSDDDEFDDEYVVLDAPQNGIIKKGYLKKEGKYFKSWKKRWFILENNGTVSYYQSKDDLNKPLNKFSVKNYTKLIPSTKIKH